jgi:hypothetical protein
MSCKGICDRYKARKKNHLSRYALGQKRCQFCSIWVEWDGNSCPCCSMRLRQKPRSKNGKKLVALQTVCIEHD